MLPRSYHSYSQMSPFRDRAYETDEEQDRQQQERLRMAQPPHTRTAWGTTLDPLAAAIAGQPPQQQQKQMQMQPARRFASPPRPQGTPASQGGALSPVLQQANNQGTGASVPRGGVAELSQGGQVEKDGQSYDNYTRSMQGAASDAKPATSRGGYGGGGYAYSGFDFQQDEANRDMSKSAKYAFADAARRAAERGVPMPRTKAEAEAWFLNYIAPEMDALGYNVSRVVGDKAYLGTRENPGGEEIDFLIGADGDNPMLGWQSNMAGGPGLPGPQGAPGPAASLDPLLGAIQGTDPAELELAAQFGIDTNNPLWRQILEQLIAEQDKLPPPDSRYYGY